MGYDDVIISLGLSGVFLWLLTEKEKQIMKNVKNQRETAKTPEYTVEECIRSFSKKKKQKK